MLRVVLFVLLAVLLAVPLAAADPPPVGKKGIEGIWEGPLAVGPLELRLAFHVKKDKDDKLAVTMDSIDQGAKGIPCPEAAFADGKLTLGLPKLKASFAGTFDPKRDVIAGEWKQSDRTFPLELKRVEKPSTVNRPQHPKKPYPYRDEDVTFENPAAKLALAGTLTMPKDGGPFPAVVLVSGSGPQDRDETILGHKPFLVLADHLTRNGFAVLRFDDRGVGKSTGTHAGATSADFATDAHAAVKYLQSRKEIDAKRVGLMGHSEGGLIAPMAAADHPADVAFVVLLAGPGVPGDEILPAQAEAILKAAGDSAEKIAVTIRFQKAMTAEVKGPGSAEERKVRMKAAVEKLLAGLSDAEKKLLDAEKDAKVIDTTLDRLNDPWMHFFLAFDPRPTLARVKCPVLAVNGEFDLQVPHAANLAAIEKTLKTAGNANVTATMLPGLNHLFQPTKKGLPSEYGQIEQTFAPAALDAITAWLKKQNGVR